MKIRTVIAANISLLLLATASLQAADQTTTYIARPGSKMRIEGTANIIHPTWAIESPTIGGMLEVGAGFPTEPGQAVTPGKVEASGKAFISVRSLKSIEPDGKPYSDRMDEVTYEHLKEAEFHMINYKLTELTLKEAPKTKDAPSVKARALVSEGRFLVLELMGYLVSFYRKYYPGSKSALAGLSAQSQPSEGAFPGGAK